MKPSLNKANLRTDLDAQGHKIINLPSDQPLPPQPIADGSITDVKVHPTAAIQQSKLALTGDIPPSFLGSTGTTAVQGDLGERFSNKDQPNGYPSLDSSAKIHISQLPALAGTGTVTTVSVVTANGISGTVASSTTTPAITLSLATITPTSITIGGGGGDGFITFASQTSDPTGFATLKIWSDANEKFCFASAGINGTQGFKVKFDGPTLTADRVYHWPDKFGTIQLDSDIPTAMVGVGGSHKGGLVIDTGASGSANDYLARDATWKSAATFSAPTYQPQAPTPQLFPTTNTTGARTVTIGPNGLTGASLFYQVGGGGTGPFIPYTAGVSVAAGAIIYSYSSKAGYTNSALASYTNPNA